MADFPEQVLTDIQNGKAYLANLVENYQNDMYTGGCTCDLKVMYMLTSIVRDLVDKTILGDYDIISQSLYETMMEVIGGDVFIMKLYQTITFPPLPNNLSVDSPAYDPQATATSGLTVTYTSSNPDVAIIIDNKIKVVSIGETEITAYQYGNEDYFPAEPVTRPLSTVLNSSVFYGSASQLPTTEAEILGLNYTPFVEDITLNTGTSNTWFVLAMKQDKVIESVTDLDGGDFDDITNQYILRSTITVDGDLMNVFAMQVAIPYLTNHRHKIILQ